MLGSVFPGAEGSSVRNSLGGECRERRQPPGSFSAPRRRRASLWRYRASVCCGCLEEQPGKL